MIRLIAGAVLTIGLTAAWVLTLDGDATETVPTTQYSGEAVFLTKGCIGCHTAAGHSSRTNVGPNLVALADRAGQRVDGLSAEDYVRQSVLAPQAYIVTGYSGIQMPALALKAGELDALVEFLLSSEGSSS